MKIIKLPPDMQLEPAREWGRENPAIQRLVWPPGEEYFSCDLFQWLSLFDKHISICLTQILIHFLFTKKYSLRVNYFGEFLKAWAVCESKLPALSTWPAITFFLYRYSKPRQSVFIQWIFFLISTRTKSCFYFHWSQLFFHYFLVCLPTQINQWVI